jgi:hypothetical protein
MMANDGGLTNSDVQVARLQLNHRRQQLVDQNGCLRHETSLTAGLTNCQTPEALKTLEVLRAVYPHYFARRRTINWPTEKTGKNNWAEFLSGTPKRGLHTNEQGHSSHPDWHRILRQNGFLDCNPIRAKTGRARLPPSL